MSGSGGSEQPQRGSAISAAAPVPVLAADGRDAADAGGVGDAEDAADVSGDTGGTDVQDFTDVEDLTDAPGAKDTEVGGDAGDAHETKGAADAPGGVLALLGDPSLAEVQLASRAESASRARRMVLSVIRKWGMPQYGDTVELLVSELVGNAVRHTGASTVGLRMRRRRGWMRVEVRDPSRALPCLLPVRELDISGRGLFLVDRLADRWGVDLQSRGKVTWFELRVPER